jgi:hypothetical protein
MSPVIGRRFTARKLASLASILVATVVLSGADGCSAVTGPGVEGTGSVMELRLRWAQWLAAGPPSYSYEVQRTCFCPEEYRTPARVEVRDRQVIDARVLATGEPLPIAIFDPIDSLFADAIEVAERGGPVEVTYHPRFSYPISLEIGTLANDAGVRYEVTALIAR